MKWLRIKADFLNEYRVQTMSAGRFKHAFAQAAAGKGGPLSEWVKPFDGRPSAAIWAKLRDECYSRDDYTCQYCGQRGGRLECDHVIPIARGGTNDLGNLKTACFACNRSKRAKTLEEWRA